MRRARTDEEKKELARRVARTINDFIGTLHGARWILVEAIRRAELPETRHAARYALRIAFGVVALTLRKFEDLWGTHIPQLIPEQGERPAQGQALIAECEERSLRDTANRLIAHYGEKGGWPLSQEEIEALIRANGWETEEEVVTCLGPVIEAMTEIRDAIMARCGIASLE